MPQATIEWQGGDISMLSSPQFTRQSLIRNDGRFEIHADAVVTNDINKPSEGILNTGTIIKVGGIATTIEAPFITKNNGVVDVNGKQISFDGGMMLQGGVVSVDGGILRATSITQMGGILLLEDGTLDVSTGGLHIQPGARLEGHGLIWGNVLNAGVVDLRVTNMGNALYGTLLIMGDYVQAGSLWLNLFQRQGKRYDSLWVLGTASLAGTLNVLAPMQPVVAVNDRIYVLLATQITGNFDLYQLPNLPNPRVWAANPIPGPFSLELNVI